MGPSSWSPLPSVGDMPPTSVGIAYAGIGVMSTPALSASVVEATRGSSPPAASSTDVGTFSGSSSWEPLVNTSLPVDSTVLVAHSSTPEQILEQRRINEIIKRRRSRRRMYASRRRQLARKHQDGLPNVISRPAGPLQQAATPTPSASASPLRSCLRKPEALSCDASVPTRRTQPVSFSSNSETLEVEAFGRLRTKIRQPLKSTFVLDPSRAHKSPGRSTCEALARAKDLALACGYKTDFGWPVYWWEGGALSYSANPNGVLYIDQPHKPSRYGRIEAEEILLKDGQDSSRVHLGLLPSKCPRVVHDSGYAASMFPAFSLKGGFRTLPDGRRVSAKGSSTNVGPTFGGADVNEELAAAAEFHHQITVCLVKLGEDPLALATRRKIDVMFWVLDSGSSIDLVSSHAARNASNAITSSASPFPIITANGTVTIDKELAIRLEATGEYMKPYVVEDSPPLLSLGFRCMELGGRSGGRGFLVPSLLFRTAGNFLLRSWTTYLFSSPRRLLAERTILTMSAANSR